MKQILLTISLAMGFATVTNGQCNQNLELSSAKTDLLNASYQSVGSRDEHVVIDITASTITITPNGNNNDALTGNIKNVQCHWKIPFKEGKTIIKTDLVDPSGDVKDATITIEGKDGKITLLAEAKERPDQKMLLEVDKFESKDQSKQSSHATSASYINAPEALNSFFRSFKNVENVSWTEIDDMLRIGFTSNGHQAFAYYQSDELIVVAIEIKAEELPVALKAQLSGYKGYTISQLYELEKNGKKEYYALIDTGTKHITLKGRNSWKVYLQEQG